MADLALIGDIGATNARFSLCREVVGGSPELLDTPVILSTQAYTEGEALLRDAAEALQKPKLTGALLAVAGACLPRGLRRHNQYRACAAAREFGNPTEGAGCLR